MKWTFPSQNMECSLLPVGISVENQNRMANSVDPEDTSHQDLLSLHRYLAGL